MSYPLAMKGDNDVIFPFPTSLQKLSILIFFVAFVQMLYHLGVMQWVIKHFAWFFFKTMNICGAEAVVAAASPFVGQGESACLVKPYVDIMTESELHLIMPSGWFILF
jgi:concentrative nucleoside transporter, CNT family